MSLTWTVCICALALLTDVSGRNLEQTSASELVASWERAYHHCTAQGAVLAAPIAENRNDLIAQIVMFFMRVKAIHSPNLQFVSTEGVPLHDASVSDMMSNLRPQQGDCLSMDRDRLRVAPCSAPFPYICYKPLENETTTAFELEEPTTTSEFTEPCRRDRGYSWEVSTSSCYKYHSEEKTWQQAQEACAAEHAHLVVIGDELEAAAVRDMNLPRHQYGTSIGLRYHNSNQTWMSVQGNELDRLYNKWDRGSVPVPAPAYVCGAITHDVKLDHWTCDQHKLPFLCEMEPFV